MVTMDDTPMTVTTTPSEVAMATTTHPEDATSHPTRWESPDQTFAKYILEKGKGIETPNLGATCVVQIIPLVSEGLEQGLVGYPMYEENEITLGEGDTEISEILDACFETMQAAEVCEVEVAKETVGMGTGDELLRFQLELKEFTRKEDPWHQGSDEILSIATHHKNKGTECFKAAKIRPAIRRYSRALKLLVLLGKDLPEDLKAAYINLRVACYQNLAACQIKQSQHDFVIKNCSKALLLDSGLVKALYRRGCSYTAVNEFEKARQDLQRALEIEPANKATIEQLKVLEKKSKAQDEKYAKAMAKMFGGPAK
ncbi:FKBPL [Branchiostoma lanceolatum]|uniref:FKBPL protein n=1 Tax=Branchiostoma lanceolatum TaxID=7740 RepID=A0A8K0ACU5_BRALA|nr:FKBPL [Branchiostoma lanceolatum]